MTAKSNTHCLKHAIVIHIIEENVRLKKVFEEGIGTRTNVAESIYPNAWT